MEKWQCQKVSKFSEVFVFKDPNSYQHWQREQGSFVSECCLLKNNPTESIMGVYDSCKITERQGWVLGIAAQKIIDPRRKKYKCDIIFNETTKPCNF